MEKRIGEEEEQRSLLETGGEGGISSKKDLLLPQTAADILKKIKLSPTFLLQIPPPTLICKTQMKNQKPRRENNETIKKIETLEGIIDGFVCVVDFFGVLVGLEGKGRKLG